MLIRAGEGTCPEGTRPRLDEPALTLHWDSCPSDYGMGSRTQLPTPGGVSTARGIFARKKETQDMETREKEYSMKRLILVCALFAAIAAALGAQEAANPYQGTSNPHQTTRSLPAVPRRPASSGAANGRSAGRRRARPSAARLRRFSRQPSGRRQ